VSLLRLCLILAQKVCSYDCHDKLGLDDLSQPSLRDQVYVSFDLLSGLPPPIASSVGEQVVAGLILIIQKHRDIIRSVLWQLFVSFFSDRSPPYLALRRSGILFLL
jgi:brefeldin A-resistance guanine nucleotide exchange factor 1